MVFRLFIFIFSFFCLEAALGQDTYKSAEIATTVMVIFSKVLLRLYHSCVKVSSQQLRDTLTTVF